MPKNKGKGGKKFKRGKHENISKREMIFKEENEGQAYAVVDKMLGNGRVSLYYFKRNDDNENRKYQALGIIRGSMKKRVWISPNDVVLVSLRGFEEGKVDILHKYEQDEVQTLITIEEIPRNIEGVREQSTNVKRGNQNNTEDETTIIEDENDIYFTEETYNQDFIDFNEEIEDI